MNLLLKGGVYFFLGEGGDTDESGKSPVDLFWGDAPKAPALRPPLKAKTLPPPPPRGARGAGPGLGRGSGGLLWRAPDHRASGSKIRFVSSTPPWFPSRCFCSFLPFFSSRPCGAEFLSPFIVTSLFGFWSMFEDGVGLLPCFLFFVKKKNHVGMGPKKTGASSGFLCALNG